MNIFFVFVIAAVDKLWLNCKCAIDILSV